MMNNQTENQIENLNQRVEVIEESLTSTIKKLAVEHKRIVDKLVEQQQKLDDEHEHTEKILLQLEKNRNELINIVEVNDAHYNARNHVDESVANVKSYMEQAAVYFSEAFHKLDKKINELPPKYQVKHHHHLTPKSMGLIATWMVLILGFMSSFSWGLLNQYRFNEMEDNQVKLKLMKVSAPGLYSTIDSLLQVKPQEARELAKETDL